MGRVLYNSQESKSSLIDAKGGETEKNDSLFFNCGENGDKTC